MRKFIFAVSLVLFSLPLLFAVLLFLAALPKTPELGNALARRMIERAASANGTVNLSEFGDKVCLVPEADSGRFWARQLFPDFTIALEESDDSEGIWFLLIGSNRKRSVSIYAVQQQILSWQIPEEQDSRDLIRCPSTVTITVQDEPSRCSNQERTGSGTCRIFLSY